jgi:hypothetical protein
VASTHIVESTPETVRSDYLNPAAKPAAVIQPGNTVRYPNTRISADIRARIAAWLRP